MTQKHFMVRSLSPQMSKGHGNTLFQFSQFFLLDNLSDWLLSRSSMTYDMLMVSCNYMIQ